MVADEAPDPTPSDTLAVIKQAEDRALADLRHARDVLADMQENV